MSISRLVRAFLAAIACVLWITAVAQVAYSGNHLLLNGRSYGQRSIPEKYVPGLVIVLPKKGRAGELEAELKKLGPKIERHGKVIVWFTIDIPPGFEVQWVDALREMPDVDSADVNKLFHPAATR